MNIADLTPTQLREWATHADEPCLSLFMPLGDQGAEREPGRIRLKTHLERAESALRERGVGKGEIDKLTKPLHDLLEGGVPMSAAAQTWVILRSANVFETLQTGLAIPDTLVVGERFYIKPLLPLVNDNQPFYLLALTQNEVRVFSGDRYTLEPVDIPTLPRNLDEALNDDDVSKPVQFHTATDQGAADRPAIFHGHGPGQDDAKERVLRFCQLIDNALVGHFGNQDVPLVLAGPEPTTAAYKQASSYNNVVDETVNLEHRQVNDQELRGAAWKVLAPQAKSDQKQHLTRLNEALSKKRGTVDLPEAVAAAYQGRVETAFVNPTAQQWGRVDPGTGEVDWFDEPRPDAEELTNYTVAKSLQHGGAAFTGESSEMPADVSLAVIYRD